ncbi:hypothetical protein CLF_102890 [Clonorchis sinensis]|uniref:Uncharacterized protein n=1 Tax=Clonorchis sinensis TaxID=79923 RepID=G7YN83_CLOSI|nr:hypothetical protein CLF_102890 [Clonorchis sinensis]
MDSSVVGSDNLVASRLTSISHERLLNRLDRPQSSSFFPRQEGHIFTAASGLHRHAASRIDEEQEAVSSTSGISFLLRNQRLKAIDVFNQSENAYNRSKNHFFRKVWKFVVVTSNNSHCRLRTALLTSSTRLTTQPVMDRASAESAVQIDQTSSVPAHRPSLIAPIIISEDQSSALVTTTAMGLSVRQSLCHTSEAYVRSSTFEEESISFRDQTRPPSANASVRAPIVTSEVNSLSLARPPSASSYVLRRMSTDSSINCRSLSSQTKSISQPQSPEFHPRRASLPVSPCRLPMKKRKLNWSQLDSDALLCSPATPSDLNQCTSSSCSSFDFSFLNVPKSPATAATVSNISDVTSSLAPSVRSSQPSPYLSLPSHSPLIINCSPDYSPASLARTNHRNNPIITTSSMPSTSSFEDRRPRSIPAPLTSTQITSGGLAAKKLEKNDVFNSASNISQGSGTLHNLFGNEGWKLFDSQTAVCFNHIPRTHYSTHRFLWTNCFTNQRQHLAAASLDDDSDRCDRPCSSLYGPNVDYTRHCQSIVSKNLWNTDVGLPDVPHLTAIYCSCFLLSLKIHHSYVLSAYCLLAKVTLNCTYRCTFPSVTHCTCVKGILERALWPDYVCTCRNRTNHVVPDHGSAGLLSTGIRERAVHLFVSRALQLLLSTRNPVVRPPTNTKNCTEYSKRSSLLIRSLPTTASHPTQVNRTSDSLHSIAAPSSDEVTNLVRPQPSFIDSIKRRHSMDFSKSSFYQHQPYNGFSAAKPSPTSVSNQLNGPTSVSSSVFSPSNKHPVLGRTRSVMAIGHNPSTLAAERVNNNTQVSSAFSGSTTCTTDRPMSKQRTGFDSVPDLPQLMRRWLWLVETAKLSIIIIDSMTSVLNTDASLPYNHDLFESLIVKKKNKDGRGVDSLLPYYNHSERRELVNGIQISEVRAPNRALPLELEMAENTTPPDATSSCVKSNEDPVNSPLSCAPLTSLNTKFKPTLVLSSNPESECQGLSSTDTPHNAQIIMMLSPADVTPTLDSSKLTAADDVIISADQRISKLDSVVRLGSMKSSFPLFLVSASSSAGAAALAAATARATGAPPSSLVPVPVQISYVPTSSIAAKTDSSQQAVSPLSSITASSKCDDRSPLEPPEQHHLISLSTSVTNGKRSNDPQPSEYKAPLLYDTSCLIGSLDNKLLDSSNIELVVGSKNTGGIALSYPPAAVAHPSA